MLINILNLLLDLLVRDVKKVDDLSDEIRKFLSTPKGQKVEIKDYSPVLDTIIWNNKQVYQRQYFDLSRIRVDEKWCSI